MTDAKPDSRARDGLLTSAASDAQRLAAGVGAAGQDAAKRFVDEQKTAAAQQIEEVAQVLDTTAETVEKIIPPVAPYVRDAAAGVRGASSTLRGQSVDDVINSVTQFAKRRPDLFFGGSVIAGFGLARFLMSSADRRVDGQVVSRPPRSAGDDVRSPHIPSNSDAARGVTVPVVPGTAAYSDASVALDL